MSEVNKPAPPTKLDNLPATHKPVMAKDGDAIARQLIEQGRRLFEKWNLPEVYKEVVTEHHDEELDTQNIVVALVWLANLSCRKRGLGLGKYPEIVLPTTAEAQFFGDRRNLTCRIRDKALGPFPRREICAGLSITD